jgi:hypothetical protein
MESLKSVSGNFPKELAKLVTFRNLNDRVVIRIKQSTITGDNFSKLESIVSGLGGRWVQTRKDSYFEIMITNKRFQ